MQNHRPGIMLPRCCCPGAWYLVPGSWIMLPRCCPGALDHGPYCLDPGPCCLDPGARIILDLVQRPLGALDHGSIWPLVPGIFSGVVNKSLY